MCTSVIEDSLESLKKMQMQQKMPMWFTFKITAVFVYRNLKSNPSFFWFSLFYSMSEIILHRSLTSSPSTAPPPSSYRFPLFSPVFLESFRFWVFFFSCLPERVRRSILFFFSSQNNAGGRWGRRREERMRQRKRRGKKKLWREGGCGMLELILEWLDKFRPPRQKYTSFGFSVSSFLSLIFGLTPHSFRCILDLLHHLLIACAFPLILI